jgi:diguanylate cyclase (GGDEF)-like protein
MALDVATLSLAGGLITVASGVFLLVVWCQDRSTWPAFWWALGNCGLGIGIIVVGFHASLPFVVADVIAPLLLDLSAPLAFIAARVFNRGSVHRNRMVGGVAAWLALLIVTGGFAPEQIVAALGVATSACFYAAAAYEFWAGREEELRGRNPIIAVVAAYAAALFLLAVQFASTTHFVPVATAGWLGVVQFVGLVYALGVTLFLVMMLGGRSEFKYRLAALTDVLTGLPNRRGFLERAQRMLDRQAQKAEPATLLAFDLDRFKGINDTFGHAMGDSVLRTFADVLSASARPTDLLARIGGEEFVALLPGADDEAALAIANRVREAFQRVALFVEGQRIGATVSVGIAGATVGLCAILDVLALADLALYRAKREGRNRVVLADTEHGGAPSSNVVRIA